SAWGVPISIQSKTQRKYQTVRAKIELNEAYLTAYFRGDWMVPLDDILVRWFPATWTLAERKEWEKFQAVLRDIPKGLTHATLYDNQRKCPSPFLQDTGAKAFKLITTVDKKRKLVGFFESWTTLHQRLIVPTTWNADNLDWS